MENLTVSTQFPETIAKILTFSWVDYTIFASMFGVSALIGIYFGCFGTKQATTSEYLLGSRSMSVLPVAFSLTASHLSGITLLGVPSEIYAYGTQYMACILIPFLTSAIINEVYVPVFYVLEVNSTYEYLKRRFDERIRLVALVLYIICTLLYIPLVIYIPALAFSQVSGINIHTMAFIICGICVFYTTLGGLKGVVWTDTLQFTITLTSMAAVLIIGVIASGGVFKVWEVAKQGDRLEFFNMDPDLTVRMTLWSILIGQTTAWVSGLGLNPTSVQRFMSLPSLKKAKICSHLVGVGILITKLLCGFSGLIVYARYHDCDPFTAKKISKPDQILPYYVLDVARNIPGLPGLFISGVFSTALSTMSSHLNTLAGTIYEDFIYRYMPLETTDTRANNIIKSSVIISGLICLGLVFVVENLGGVIQISSSLSGITTGPLVGLFSLGMLFPSATTKGALYGSTASLAIMTWMVAGNEYHIMQGHIPNVYKPFSVENCTDFNATSLFTNITVPTSLEMNSESEVSYPFRISFYWYYVIGAVITILVGLLVGWISNEDNEKKYDKDLYSPIIHRFIPENPQQYEIVHREDKFIIDNLMTKEK